jgi:hypothetical protein
MVCSNQLYFEGTRATISKDHHGCAGDESSDVNTNTAQPSVPDIRPVGQRERGSQLLSIFIA